jgi:hypothetical protein
MSLPMRKSNIDKIRIEISGTKTRRFAIPKSQAGKVIELLKSKILNLKYPFNVPCAHASYPCLPGWIQSLPLSPPLSRP